jgi:hypothetical protein
MFPSMPNSRSSLAVRRCTQNPTLARTLAKKDARDKLLAQITQITSNNAIPEITFSEKDLKGPKLEFDYASQVSSQ